MHPTLLTKPKESVEDDADDAPPPAPPPAPDGRTGGGGRGRRPPLGFLLSSSFIEHLPLCSLSYLHHHSSPPGKYWGGGGANTTIRKRSDAREYSAPGLPLPLAR